MRYLFIFLSLFLISSPALSGPGHDHGESAFAQSGNDISHFSLGALQMENLDIKSAKPEYLPLQQTVEMLAFIELLPENKATISPHFEGKIVNIYTKVGEKVTKDQPLVTLQPVNVGSKEVTLISPISGYVTSLESNPGEILQTDDRVMEIGAFEQMLVHGIAYETPDINKLEVGQTAEIHLDIDPDRHIEGKVQRINRVINPSSRTFSVYALIDTPEGDIQPGLQGTIEIFIGNNTPVLAVPKKAVLGELDSYFVYVIKGNEVEKRDVIIGTKNSYHFEIKSGLKASDQVVTNGNYQLQYLSLGGVQDHHDHEDSHAVHDDDQHQHDDHNHDADEHSHDDHDHDHSGHEH